MNVLIVDDSEIVAERMEAMLADVSEELRVTWHARNTAEGRQVLQCNGPDVIILDIQMPGESGIELLEEVKRDTPSTVVIVLTNYPFPQYRDRCLKAGADFFFDKSNEFSQVPAVLLDLLRSRSPRNEAVTR